MFAEFQYLVHHLHGASVMGNGIVIDNSMEGEIIKDKYRAGQGVPHEMFHIPAVLRLGRINKDQIIFLLCLKLCAIPQPAGDSVRKVRIRDVFECLLVHLRIDFQGIDSHIPSDLRHADCGVSDGSADFQNIADILMFFQIMNQKIHSVILHKRNVVFSCLIMNFIQFRLFHKF